MSSPAPLADNLRAPIERLIRTLDSLTDGDLAVDALIACGKPAIGPLEELLLHGKPRTIALPRRRTVRALGGLEAREVLLAYFEKAELPPDPVVLFAEDAVRSEVAHELLRWRDGEIFPVLLRGARQRATFGLIEALGEFARTEAIPLLFESLEDDLCRGAAFAALLKTPDATRQYAMLALRGAIPTTLEGGKAGRRRRGVVELLRKLTITEADWGDVSHLLSDDDPAVVLSAASVGFSVARQGEHPTIIHALFRVTRKLNWLQEDEMIHLLDEHKDVARGMANQILNELLAHGEHANWLSPTWRILGHLVPTGTTGKKP